MWAGHRWYQVFERRYRVGSQDPRLLDDLDRLLAPFAASGAGARMADTYCITVDGTRRVVFRDCLDLTGGAEPDLALTALLADLNQRVVADFEGFAVHAGVVRSGDRILAIPVASGGGKSTLTAALVNAGLQYLSDEGLCVRYESGHVVPYPKPVSLDRWSRETLGLPSAGDVFEVPYSVDDLDGSVGSGGRLTDIIFPIYDEFSEPHLQSIPRSAAQAQLLKLSFNHYKQPEQAFRLSAELVKGAQCGEFRFSDPTRAAQFLKGHLSSQA